VPGALAVHSESPSLAVAEEDGDGAAVTLVRTHEAKGGKVRPTVFTLEVDDGGEEVVSVGTLPRNVLVAAPPG